MHRNEPQSELDQRVTECAGCGRETRDGYLLVGLPYCSACYHGARDVQQSVEADRKADVAAEDIEQPF